MPHFYLRRLSVRPSARLLGWRHTGSKTGADFRPRVSSSLDGVWHLAGYKFTIWTELNCGLISNGCGCSADGRPRRLRRFVDAAAARRRWVQRSGSSQSFIHNIRRSVVFVVGLGLRQWRCAVARVCPSWTTTSRHATRLRRSRRTHHLQRQRCGEVSNCYFPVANLQLP